MKSFINSSDSSVSHHNSSYGGVANELDYDLQDFVLEHFDHPEGEAQHEISTHPPGLNDDTSSTTPHLSGLIDGVEPATSTATLSLPHVPTATPPTPPPPSMVKEVASASTKYTGEPRAMPPPNTAIVKKRKRDDTPQTPSKKTKNHPFSILKHYSGDPKVCIITCPNSVVEFYCEIRKLLGKGGRPITKSSPVLALEYSTYDEVKTHLDKILKSSVEELECRNKSSTANIKYPNLGSSIMLKYSVTHSPTYEAGIESHMDFVCERIADTILDNIKIINV